MARSNILREVSNILLLLFVFNGVISAQEKIKYATHNFPIKKLGKVSPMKIQDDFDAEGEMRRKEGEARREGETRHDVRRDRARYEHVMSKLIRVSSAL